MKPPSPRHADIDRRLAAFARNLQHNIDTDGWAIINVPFQYAYLVRARTPTCTSPTRSD